jgi:hypothetical protein
MLTVDAACKQYIIMIASLVKGPPPESSKNKKMKSLYEGARTHLMVQYVMENPAALKIMRGIDDAEGFIESQVSGFAPVSDELPYLSEVFNFIKDPFRASDSALLVCQYAVPGIEKIVEEWVETNVWNKADDEAEEKKKAASKSKRKRD